ncbi:MAG: thioredoxin TrxC [Acidobacteria bacterium]|nr:MAG: thioredoxin TrxC [Acidobacteriota bacterium]
MTDKIMLKCEACGAMNRVDERRMTSQPVCGRCGKPLTRSLKPVAVSAADFQREVVEWPGTVLVDFWAPWCGPCRAVAPMLEDLAARRAGSLKVVKVNTDENAELASRFGIFSIPTLILFHQGNKVNQVSGAMPRAQLELWIDSSVAAGKA